MANDKSSSTDADFVIIRIFNARPEFVFQAWTDPQYVARWWGPRGFTTTFCKIEFRVGGFFHYCMRSPGGKDYWNKGVYREIVVPQKIVSTMYFSDAEGNRLVPADYAMGSDFPSEMLDVVTFAVHECNKTKLTLHRNHSTPVAERYGEDLGWSQSLERLAELIANGRLDRSVTTHNWKSNEV
jgi:uncharacterized protein YndB with AHSA1/START domain